MHVWSMQYYIIYLFAGLPQRTWDGVDVSSIFNTWNWCEVQPGVLQMKVAGRLKASPFTLTCSIKLGLEIMAIVK